MSLTILGISGTPQWVPVRTPTVYWGPVSGKAVGVLLAVERSNTEFNKAVTLRRNTGKHGRHERWQ